MSPPSLAQRIGALSQLGRVMALIGQGAAWPGHSCGLAEEEYVQLDATVVRAHLMNGWFTEENVRHAFASWGGQLTTGALRAWTDGYPELEDRREVRTVGLILAGNIPLVGLHDLLCVWLSGHRARVKCSSQDPALLPALFGVLDRFCPGVSEQITFLTGEMGAVDAVIATGSNNSARYFEHYFGHLPRIVRKGRMSVAVLDGHETPAELAALGEDIFRYFGLGCRNVSRIHVPQDFDLDRLFTAIYPWHPIVQHNKYGNNYDYTRALWLLDGVVFVENGFILLREDRSLASPVGALHYTRYTDREQVEGLLANEAERIQCIVGHGQLPFGSTQQPGLAEYADGVDTLRFLLTAVS